MKLYREFLQEDIKEAIRQRSVLPYKWDGSHGLMVGPFRSQQVAAYFARYIATPALIHNSIVESVAGWYLDARSGNVSNEVRNTYERRSEAS